MDQQHLVRACRENAYSDGFEELTHHVRAYIATKGILMGIPNEFGRFRALPMTLFPAQVPRVAFQHVLDIAPVFGELYHRVSRDKEFIKDSLQGVVGHDSFTGRLLEIMNSVTDPSEFSLSVFRSDYMLSGKANSVFKQIEFNTIASGFAHLSGKVSACHRFVFDRLYRLSNELIDHVLPRNKPVSKMCEAIAHVLGLFREKQSVSDAQNKDLEIVMLMVVQDDEGNFVDQRGIEYELWEQHGIRTIRKTLGEISHYSLTASQALIVENCVVGLVYFRAGYTPSDYPSEQEWQARILIESCRAVKCPNIPIHLSGTKRIQQQLSSLSVLQRFLSAEKAEAILETCAELFNFEQGQDQSFIDKALENPQNFVLKPQREGGGNNLYGQELKLALETLSKEQLRSYILMERLFPPSQPSALFRAGKAEVCSTLQEIGVYSVLVTEGDEILENHGIGHLVRTKVQGVDEGGVNSGFSCLDSPLLLD